MFTTFKELVDKVELEKKETTMLLGQELNRDLVEQVKIAKSLNDHDYVKLLNQERIKALELKLIQGGKA